MALPIQNGAGKDMLLLQTTWASVLNPLIERPTNQMNVLKAIPVVSGVNVINHLLGHQMRGWTILDIDSAATFYRSAPFNSLTLSLTFSAPANISLGVF